MKKIAVPNRSEVSENNQAIFDALEEKVGRVPNIYATYAHSDNALGRYMEFANGKTSLSPKEKEAVYLVTSQVNGCKYCHSAHTATAKMQGFSEVETIAIRKASVDFDPKLSAIVNLAQQLAEKKGAVDDKVLEDFWNAGFDEEKLVDLVVTVGEKSVTNILHNVTQIPIDFPEAKPIN